MEPTQQQSASSYYNKYRKRSFFLSRVTVLTSMVVLIITLGINISLLNSNTKTSVTSHADTPSNPAKLLPTLPAGCIYQQTKGGLAVVCPTPTPTIAVPINIALPQLPPQCTLSTATNGSEIHCTTLVPIPTIAVTLPATCEVTNQLNTVSCNVNNQVVPVPLPSLPGGCLYEQLAKKYYVACKSE
jgi:hypothetical protein